MFSDVRLICHPNTKTFYVRIKDDSKKKGVEFHLCEISIESFSLSMMKKELLKIFLWH